MWAGLKSKVLVSSLFSLNSITENVKQIPGVFSLAMFWKTNHVIIKMPDYDNFPFFNWKEPTTATQNSLN